MMVKIGNATTINMTGIKSVHLQEKTVTEKVKTGIFKEEKKEKTTIDIVIFYKDMEGKDRDFTLQGFTSFRAADETRNEILRQIVELDIERATTTLENAIRNA